MPEPVDPGQSLIDTIAKSDLSQVALDAAEIALDQVLNDGLLREIPIVSAVRSVVRAGVSIRDHLYLKKIICFLVHLNDISEAERRGFAEQLGGSEKERRRAGENLLLLLDRFNDIRKPDILGRMFADQLRGDLEWTTFQRLAFALERMNLALAPHLLDLYRERSIQKLRGNDAIQDLAICGLVTMELHSGAVRGGPGGYFQNDLGEKFASYLQRAGPWTSYA